MRNNVQRKSEEIFHGQSIRYSISDIKSLTPRVNFKKIKLSSFQNLDNTLKQKNITRIVLDSNLEKIKFPLKRKVTETVYKESHYNPLRKRTDIEVLPYDISIDDEIEKEESRDVTFNLEAQIAQEKENVILSPAIVSVPPFKEDVLSTSGEQSTFVWPPVKQKSRSEKGKKLKEKKAKKKKPYILRELKQPQSQQTGFPWTVPEQEYLSLENIFEGGLESELLDIPNPTHIIEEESQPQKEVKSEQLEISQEITDAKDMPHEAVLKAFSPSFDNNLVNETINALNFDNIKFDKSFLEQIERGRQAERGERGEKMFDRFTGARLSPIRIIILGGFAATLGYLLWGYISPVYNVLLLPQVKNKQERVVVKDLFKEKSGGLKARIDEKNIEKITSEEEFFKPITEKDRIALIQKAKESIETRLDPFGQESVLPVSVIEDKLKEDEDKPPPEIPLIRKQVELVGVISTVTKDLALVNVYNAEYSVNVLDDKVTKETKLKSALSMAVPNRIEVSLLDSIEDWYVKQITKSKARSEDPTIELVKGDKKFKLRVGQKLLLPEEKRIEEIEEEL